MDIYVYDLWFNMLIYIIISFFIIKPFQKWMTVRRQCHEIDRIFLFPVNELKTDAEKSLKRSLIILVVVICILICVPSFGYFQLLLFICAFFTMITYVFFCRKLSKQEISLIVENHHLDVGYGAALWYYENYIKLFMPNEFRTRVDEFKSKEQVELPEKLFILIPESCRVCPYIDNSNHIERCRELPATRITHSGIKDRTYNITVYHIRSHEGDRGFRWAIEYAQPLKSLLFFKNRGKCDEMEMQWQRMRFCETLREMLHDEYDSYKFCELIMYDDERNLHEVLLEKNATMSH